MTDMDDSAIACQVVGIVAVLVGYVAGVLTAAWLLSRHERLAEMRFRKKGDKDGD